MMHKLTGLRLYVGAAMLTLSTNASLSSRATSPRITAPRHPIQTRHIKNVSKKQLPADFGKKHFIKGFPHRALKQQQQQEMQKNLAHLFSTDGFTIRRALFSPDDNVSETLINLIKSEQSSIKIAVYSFTDQAIVQALEYAVNKGISVELVTDPSTVNDPFNKIKQIHEKGVIVFVYKPTHNNPFIPDKMHNKFMILANNTGNKKLLCTGSRNLTKSAQTNQENVIFTEDRSLFEQFNNQFERLKRRSERYKI